MHLKALLRQNKGRMAWGALLAVLVGWQLQWIPAGETLTGLSYDLPFLFSEPYAPSNLVLIEMDEVSHLVLRQTHGQYWDRRLHAQLVDYLRTNGADLVVFDVVFTDDGPDPAANHELAQAIRAHGRVVLGAEVVDTRRMGVVGRRILPPNDTLREATTNWGTIKVGLEGSGVIRKIFHGTEQKPLLAWVAASLQAPQLVRSDHLAERWIRYYGPGGTLSRVSYSEVTNQPSGFFRGQTVFIGGRPKTRFVADEVDEFFTPWRRRGHPQISGLELMATQFLNLSRGEFLIRVSPSAEFGLLTFFGILFGCGLVCVRPWHAPFLGVAGMAAVVLLAFVLFFGKNVWFDWCLVAFVQIPVALGWALLCHWRQLKKEKEWLEAPLADLWETPQGLTTASAPLLGAGTPSQTSPPPLEPLPVIHDHELLRRVGRGAYGDVWLARDALGSFHAVKVVQREAFEYAEPYEREFRGLQKFTPLSRSHPGLIHILHVGRNVDDGYFYYVMEAGDDEKSGATIDPLDYTPRNLGRELRRRAPLPLRECLELGGALCEALEFLHRHGLIHRDIKPPNIIFVNGQPKLADIGLVTDIASSRREISIVGTEGYLPPEGPGTVAGDVYALGKVVLEMTQRRAPNHKLPVESEDSPDQTGAGWEGLRTVINTACAPNPEERYKSAHAMRQALLQVPIVG